MNKKRTAGCRRPRRTEKSFCVAGSSYSHASVRGQIPSEGVEGRGRGDPEDRELARRPRREGSGEHDRRAVAHHALVGVVSAHPRHEAIGTGRDQAGGRQGARRGGGATGPGGGAERRGDQHGDGERGGVDQEQPHGIWLLRQAGEDGEELFTAAVGGRRRAARSSPPAVSAGGRRRGRSRA